MTQELAFQEKSKILEKKYTSIIVLLLNHTVGLNVILLNMHTYM